MVTVRQLISMSSGIVELSNCPYEPTAWEYAYCLNNRPGGLMLNDRDPFPFMEGLYGPRDLINLVSHS